MAVSRVLLTKQSGEAFATAFNKVFETVTKIHPEFEGGHSLDGITVDFSDAEAKGFREAFGKEKANSLLRGCEVSAHHYD